MVVLAIEGMVASMTEEAKENALHCFAKSSDIEGKLSSFVNTDTRL